MHVLLIMGGVVLVLIISWLLFKATSNGSEETEKTVSSSDKLSQVLLSVIAISTTIIALQGFLNG